MRTLAKRIQRAYRFLFLYEKEITEKIFQQSYIGLNYLAIIAVSGHTYFAIVDFLNENRISAYIRLFVILVCALYIAFYTKLSKLSFDSSRWVMAIFFTMDIETQLISTDTTFHDPLAWAILPLLMIFHAFYFNGVPGKFFMYWLSLVIYYYLRVAISDKSGFADHKLISVMTNLAPVWLFSGFFNLFWFRVRYTNFTYLKELEEQTKRRIKTEKELAVQKEREAIFYNLHDHIGSAIVDLSMLVKSLSPKQYPEKENLDSMEYYIHQIEDNLRMQINTFQDRRVLENDFLKGIQLILYRRYAVYKREIVIILDNITQSNDSIFKEPIRYWSLYSLCMEICNNDLKYGFGLASWKWTKKENDFLELEIQSNTTYQPNRQVTGKGTETIEQRLASLSGKMQFTNKENSFHIQITLPLNGGDVNVAYEI
ncbi:MAG: hypothetical protein IPO06_10300 [Leptospiraceae bacterium]|nr:hypothetical protein [Leptospiraceae bacterium]